MGIRLKWLLTVGIFGGLLIPNWLIAWQETTDASLAEFLKEYLQIAATESALTHFASSSVDLNGDAKPEIVVYVRGENWCGSGGCLALILERTGASFRVLGRITLVRTPVRMLKTMNHGWRSIGVWVQGGGIQPGYEAELRFDGKKYPGNPSIQPARRRVRGSTTGVNLISDESSFERLD